MKILFLDIDGVLNDHATHTNLYCGIQKEKTELLNEVLDKTDCNIVISSAWRYMILDHQMTVKGFEYLLLTHGLKCHDRIIDVTVSDEAVSTRGKQISKWLADYKDKYDVKEYVVVDDLPFDILSCGHPLVQPDSDVGLEQRHIEELITILGFENGNENTVV